jgi:hypothetical protein
MEVILYDDSGQLSERLIELIGMAVEGLLFYQVVSVKQLIKILTEQQPPVAVLHLNFANSKAAALIKTINAACKKTALILLFDIAEEYDASLFNIRNGNYVFDTYKDFDKVSGIMREIMKKNQKH